MLPRIIFTIPRPFVMKVGGGKRETNRESRTANDERPFNSQVHRLQIQTFAWLIADLLPNDNSNDNSMQSGGGIRRPFPIQLWFLLLGTKNQTTAWSNTFHFCLFANNCLRCCQSPPIDVLWKAVSIIDFPCKLPSAFEAIVVFWQTSRQKSTYNEPLSSLVMMVTVCCLPFALIATRPGGPAANNEALKCLME